MQCWTKALYDFDGQTEVELSFKVGDIIGVADPDPSSGWWFGELYGTGVYIFNFSSILLRPEINLFVSA
jgi:hypothetical protein